MTRSIAAVVVAGVALIVVGGIATSFDATTLTVLFLAVVVGAAAIAMSRRFSSGAVAPAQCEECGGLLSPSAPYCNHCGVRRTPAS
jgi:drug/metabolite transporter (DMT)-like permease